MGIQIGARMGRELAGTMKRFQDPTNLTEQEIKDLAEIFKRHKNYQKLYIDVNGYFHTSHHVYTGGFPEWKDEEGKVYARMDKQPQKYWYQPENRWKAKNMPVPNPNFEIVTIVEREDILARAAKK